MSAPVDIPLITNQIYEKVRSLIVNRKVDQSVLIEIATHCMELVESMGNMPGPTKKAIVLAVLTRLVDEIPVNNDVTEAVKSGLKLTVQSVLPAVIDKLVAFANGDSTLSKITDEIIGNGCCAKKVQPAPAARRHRR